MRSLARSKRRPATRRSVGVALGVAALSLGAALAGACGPVPAVDRGKALFADPGFAREPSNVFSCATCHATSAAAPNDLILPGYTLADVTARPSWWGGAYDDLLDAVNECYVEFMRGTALTRDDPDGRALLVYLESISPDATAPALPLTVVKQVAPTCGTGADCATFSTVQQCLPDGMGTGGMFCDFPGAPTSDATRGADLYRRACANCHGAKSSGDGRLGPKVSLIPDESVQQHGCTPKSGWRAITVEKVRHGKFFTVGGNMPLYSTEALTDAQLGDLLEYLGTPTPTGCATM